MSTSVTIQQCKKGSEQTLYYNTGTESVPVWVEHEGMVEDLDIGETDDLGELSSRRASRLVKEYAEGETELAITGTQTSDPDYEGWQYLNAARPGGTPRDLAILGGKIGDVNSYGWRGDFWNSDRTQRGPQSGPLVNAVNLQPAAPCRAEAVEVRVVKIVIADTIADFDPTIIPVV